MPCLEMFIELFRQNGRKITPQRRLILEVLTQHSEHPTAEEIYQQVVTTMPDVSRATVYNTLRELMTLGGVTEAFESGEGGVRYETNPGNHHHLFCTRCYKLVDIHHDFAEVALSPGELAGYQIVGHQVTFYGLCPDCQEREKDEVLSSEM
ncbi:MAG TPA: Fur family transcriptional regulator [Anaerolineae bacterium]|nr:Fur family transcriptional regulator [Anaerolineae bacterium]